MNIQPFCGVDRSTRYPRILSPFRIGEWLYATDGRVLVRIPASNEPLPKDKVPTASELFAGFRASRCTEAWPSWSGDADTELLFSAMTELIAFREKFQSVTELDSIFRTLDRLRAHRYGRQTIAGRHIAGIYWFKISALGIVRYYAPSDKEGQIHFVCGNLQGLLMPLAPEAAEK